jgi:hypothetical protein
MLFKSELQVFFFLCMSARGAILKKKKKLWHGGKCCSDVWPSINEIQVRMVLIPEPLLIEVCCCCYCYSSGCDCL